MITKELIGKKIQQARIRKHITQEELAEAVELSSNYLSKVERGLNMLNSVKFLNIVDYLDIELSEFGIYNQEIAEDNFKELNDIIIKCDNKTAKLIVNIAKTIYNYKIL